MFYLQSKSLFGTPKPLYKIALLHCKNSSEPAIQIDNGVDYGLLDYNSM
jgi:hypothetical protein